MGGNIPEDWQETCFCLVFFFRRGFDFQFRLPCLYICDGSWQSWGKSLTPWRKLTVPRIFQSFVLATFALASMYLGFFPLVLLPARFNKSCFRSHLVSGSLANLYKQLCEIEQKQSAVNPENKSAYSAVANAIKQACTQYVNQASAVKVHLPKAPPKTRKSKKRPSTKEEESDPEWEVS